MLQQEEPEDFTISTGEQHSVREFVEISAKEIGIEIIWKGGGLKEVGIDAKTNNIIVRIDSRYFRPTEVETLLGDSSKAKNKLGWEPKISFQDLVKEMILADLKEAKRDKLCSEKGFDVFNFHE
jgi:GDPmannose 4,6-dehydratase